MYVPKVDLSFDALQDEVAQMKAARVAQDQVIQALQEGMATQAKEIAMLTAAIQEARNEGRRLGVRQELDVVIEEVAMITTNIEAVNKTVQTFAAAIEDNANGIEAVNSTVQANVAAIDDNAGSIEAVNTTVQVAVAAIEAIECRLSITTDLNTGSKYFLL